MIPAAACILRQYNQQPLFFPVYSTPPSPLDCSHQYLNIIWLLLSNNKKRSPNLYFPSHLPSLPFLFTMKFVKTLYPLSPFLHIPLIPLKTFVRPLFLHCNKRALSIVICDHHIAKSSKQFPVLILFYVQQH